MKERRRHPRFKITQMVHISPFEKETFISASGIDISREGMLFKTSFDLDIHSRLFLMLDIPLEEDDHVQINAEGLVLHVKREDDINQVGMKFTELRSSEYEKLEEFLLNLEKTSP